MSNITNAVYSCSGQTTTAPLWQWDYGQVLKLDGFPSLPDAYEVHFANVGGSESKTQIGTAEGVAIPDEYLTSGAAIMAWLFLHAGESDGETVYRIMVPVIRRAQPSDAEPTPEQQSVITEAIAALNAGVAKADAAAGEAENSATLSESWAVGGTGTREGEDADNAKHYAELAAQSADTAGYAWFDIDEATGEMIVTVANNLDNDLLFQINEAVGELEVVLR